MSILSVYVSNKDQALWTEVAEIAARRETSVSKLIAAEMRRFVREQKAGNSGLPAGFAVPGAMQDPKTQKVNAAIERIAAVVTEQLREVAES